MIHVKWNNGECRQFYNISQGNSMGCKANIGKANSNKVSDKLTDVKHGLDELWALE